MGKNRGKEGHSRWRKRLCAGLLGLGVFALSQFGAGGQGLPFGMTAQAKAWGAGDPVWGEDIVTAEARFQDTNTANTQSNFMKVYSKQTIYPLYFYDWTDESFDNAFDEDSTKCCFQEYVSSTNTWARAGNTTFQNGHTYRYKLVLKAKNPAEDSLVSGMKFYVCENNTDRSDRELWTQDPSDPYVFYSPEITCDTANVWDSYSGENPYVNPADKLKDTTLLSAIKKAKGVDGYNIITDESKLCRLKAQNLRTLSLYYMNEIEDGEDVLKGIEYFPYLRYIYIDARNDSNIKSLDLSKNQYLTEVVIVNYKGGAGIKLPASVRKLTINQSSVGYLNQSLTQMTRLHDAVIENTGLTDPDFSKCVKLRTLSMEESYNMTTVKFAKGLELKTVNLSNCDDLKNVDLNSPVSIENSLSVAFCENLTTLTVQNASIHYITAHKCPNLTTVDLSGSVIDDKIYLESCSALNSLKAKGTVFESKGQLWMGDCVFTTLNMQSSNCNPVFKEGAQLYVQGCKSLGSLTLPASEGAYLAVCNSNALTMLSGGQKKPELAWLSCDNNNLAGTLDLGNITAKVDNMGLVCSGNSNLKAIKTNGTLKTLSAKGTGIENLVLDAGCMAEGAEVDVSECEKLADLQIKDCTLKKVNAAKVPALKTLSVKNAKVTDELNITESLALQQPEFENVAINRLDIKKCSPMDKLILTAGNEVQQLYATECPALKELQTDGVAGLYNLDCQKNDSLATLKTGKNTQLSYLSLYYCPSLKELDLSGNTGLKSLYLGAYGITKEPEEKIPVPHLDLSKNINLSSIDCVGCQIDGLDVSQNKQLKRLVCSYTTLPGLDLSQNIQLDTLACIGCGLETLDLSRNVNLQEVKCGYNHLAALDLTNQDFKWNLSDVRGTNTREITTLNNYIDCSMLDPQMDVSRVEITGLYVNGSEADASQCKKRDNGLSVPKDTTKVCYDYSTGKTGTYTKAISVELNVTSDRGTPIVIFDACGGNVTPKSAAVNSVTKKVDLPTPTRDNYTFEGWYASADYADSSRVTNDQTYEKDARLYAKWTYSAVEAPEYFIRVNTTEGGKVEGGNNLYKEGETVMLQAAANKGYRFDHWQKDGVDIEGGESLTFTVEKEVTYVAVFEALDVKITITVEAGEGGTVKGGGTCPAGMTMKLEAEPNPGYKFVKWVRDGIDTEEEAVFDLVTDKSESWMAVFAETGEEIEEVTLYKVTIETGEGGNVYGAGTFREGSEVSVRAQADKGFAFAGWKQDGTVVSTEAEYKFTITGNCTLVAVFVKEGTPIDPTPDPKPSDPTPSPAPAPESKPVTEPGTGTISADGKTLTDTEGRVYQIAAKVTQSELKKDLTIADKATAGKYRITKIVEMVSKGNVRKVTGGTVEYVAPYNKDTKKIAATNTVKIAGVTFKVTSIAPNCAKGCAKLGKVVIGQNVIQIGKNAFGGCKKLKSVQIKSKNLKKVGKGAFKGIHKKAVIKVPKAKANAYKKLLKGKTNAKIK
jgi:uncharacterized repeat protein (TIGR02543 family)